ncbi:hypothetical protein Bca52824_052300 [Brassica carinata]|uniref:Uncharacterized protein n=1 Tax=Brassica carinata TaxID=52824 RepID=A0A8X7R622_BRACI|nr:hypothetical protein Bca52824_052300 [Brassica carinata]
MDKTVLVSAADGLNPRCMAAVRAFRTRRLGLESAACLDPRHRPRPLSSPITVDSSQPRCTSAVHASEHDVSGRIPRLGSTCVVWPRPLSSPITADDQAAPRPVWLGLSDQNPWLAFVGSTCPRFMASFSPSCLLLLHKHSYLQLELHQTYNTTYAYAMHLIGL